MAAFVKEENRRKEKTKVDFFLRGGIEIYKLQCYGSGSVSFQTSGSDSGLTKNHPKVRENNISQKFDYFFTLNQSKNRN